MKPAGMDKYLSTRLLQTYEMYAFPYTRASKPVKTITLLQAIADPKIMKCDVRNMAKLKVGQEVQRLGSIVWTWKRIQ